jgi:predicted nucleic acid-binding protein
LKTFFLDTNVVIDLLADRKPFSASASKLFEYADKGVVKLCISALSYTNIYYVVKNVCSHKEMILILRDLEALTETLDVTKTIISKSLHTDFKDFEDSVQYLTALWNPKTDAIVTRNVKDFKKSGLAVLTPEETLSIIESSLK